MPQTTSSDLFIPEVMADAIAGALAGRQALAGTGAFTIVPSLPESERGGNTVNVPYFGHLGELQARTDGQALDVVTLTSAAETATVVRAGKAFEITHWAQRAAGATDPYAEGARQFADSVVRQFDKAALAAASTTTLALDKHTEKLSYGHFVELLDLFGDEQDDVVAFCVHSKILASLRNIKDGSNRLMFVDARENGQPMILGRPVFVSDKHTVKPTGGGTSPDVPSYVTLAVKRGAGVIWSAAAPTVDTDKDILADSKVASVNLYYAAHLYKRMPGGTKLGAAKLESQA